MVLLDECDDASGDGGAGADILKEPVGARRGGEEKGLSDFAGGAEAAVVELAVEDESASDAGAAPDAEDIVGVVSSAEAVLAVDGDIDIVVDEDGCARASGGEFGGEGDLVPSEVGRFEDDASLAVDGARCADADGVEVGGGASGDLAGFMDGFGDAVEYGFGSLFGAGLSFGLSDDDVGVVDDADLEVGAAQVDTDDGCELIGVQGWILQRGTEKASGKATGQCTGIGEGDGLRQDLVGFGRGSGVSRDVNTH